MSMQALTVFFAWFTLINYIFLLISWFIMTAARGPIMAIHSAMTGVSKEELPRLYFQFFANYKILIITFGLVPYLVFRLVLT